MGPHHLVLSWDIDVDAAIWFTRCYCPGWYAETGRFSEAAGTARRALEVAIGVNDNAMVQALRARIAQYEARAKGR